MNKTKYCFEKKINIFLIEEKRKFNCWYHVPCRTWWLSTVFFLMPMSPWLIKHDPMVFFNYATSDAGTRRNRTEPSHTNWNQSSGASGVLAPEWRPDLCRYPCGQPRGAGQDTGEKTLTWDFSFVMKVSLCLLENPLKCNCTTLVRTFIMAFVLRVCWTLCCLEKLPNSQNKPYSMRSLSSPHYLCSGVARLRVGKVVKPDVIWFWNQVWHSSMDILALYHFFWRSFSRFVT